MGGKKTQKKHKEAIYDDALGNYDKVWGGNKVLYYRHNNRTMYWIKRASSVGLVRQV